MNKEDREEMKEIIGLIVKPIVDLLSEHHKTLFGNGSEGSQGLRVDVDRLKQDRSRSKLHFGILYGATASVGAKAVWNWLTSLTVK